MTSCNLVSLRDPGIELLVLMRACFRTHPRAPTLSLYLLLFCSAHSAVDCGTCNYLISSLCTVDEPAEAVKVLKSMDKVGCAPDSESYCTVIDAMCSFGKTNDAFRMMKEMEMNMKLIPITETGDNEEIDSSHESKQRELEPGAWRAVEVIELLEHEGCHAGFETYELVVEGCLESKEFVLAAKVVMKMTARGCIPYIRIRQKVVEGLVHVGESELYSAVRQRFAELGS
ncbi:hypothetical protein QQ045_010952 [Rhodiola kirilowii]